MNKNSLTRWLLFFCFFIGSEIKGEIFLSPKYGFIAEFRSKPEKLEFPFKSGHLCNFWVTTEKPFLVLTVNAQKITEYAEFLENPPSEALQKRLLQTSFRAFQKAENPADVKKEWVEHTAFPVLKVSFSQVGLIAEGVKSYEVSYWMLIRDTFYRVKAQGLDASKLETQIADLYKSFMVVDSKLLGELMNSVKRPSSLNVTK